MTTTKNLNRHLEGLGLTRADLPNLDDARKVWADARVAHGFEATGDTDLLAEGANVKIAKNVVRTWTLTLVPADLSLRWNVCTWATQQCRQACVMWTAGRQYDSVRRGRLARTAFLAEHPAEFLAILTAEVDRRNRKGAEWGMRLNVASDLRWENIAPWLFEGEYVRAYDYTKAPDRITPDNYRITYSHHEHRSDDWVRSMIAAGRNVAVVFDSAKHDLPATYLGIPVIDGDLTDFRYGDPTGVIVGLAAKGAAKIMEAGAGQFVTIGKAA